MNKQVKRVVFFGLGLGMSLVRFAAIGSMVVVAIGAGAFTAGRKTKKLVRKW